MKFPVHYKVSINKNRINLFLLIISILIMIPSIISASSLVQDSVRKYTINNFLKNEFNDYVILDQNYKNSQNKLVLTVSGKEIN
ncbi:TPA: TIGR00341 family protein, partial [Streptococcus pyogenes]